MKTPQAAKPEPSPKKPNDPRGTGQKRVDRSKDKILATTIELLYEAGLGLSIDEVSRRSGVAKTTIYRHWPVRSALVLEACTKLTPEPVAPDRGSFARDIAELIQTLAKLLNTARWTSVLPSIVDAAERDPEAARVFGRIQAGHAAPFRAVILRAQRRGELAKQVDPGSLVAAILGPLFYRRWFSREPIDKAFTNLLIRQATGQQTPWRPPPRNRVLPRHPQHPVGRGAL